MDKYINKYPLVYTFNHINDEFIIKKIKNKYYK